MRYNQIKPYVEKGLVSEQSHPENDDIKIFNYTQECQFSAAWDDVTTRCRGLIMDVTTNKIIANPFPKFFNYGEHLSKNMPIPDETPIVMEKLDGSLGILYHLNGKPWIATRGSFTSYQALWATRWFRDHTPLPRLNFFSDNADTHLFEIIYPENRIVVNYDFSGLVYLGSRITATGTDMNCWKWFEKDIGRRSKIIPTTNLEELAKMDEPNSEGFVVFYPKANVRMKIKFPEYVRLHKLVTGVSEIAIWEHLKEGNSLGDLLEKVPDEFFKWVTDVQYRLMKQHAEIKTRCVNDFEAINQAGRTRKEIALNFQECKHPGILFAMLDGKDYQQMIWRMVRPRGKSQFKNDIDS